MGGSVLFDHIDASVIRFDTCLHVFALHQVELKFPAPSKTGNYQYYVILRSDSHLGLDQIKPLKVTERPCVFVCHFVWKAFHWDIETPLKPNQCRSLWS